MNRIEKRIAIDKLIILLIFKEIDFPLSKPQVTDIVLQNNLMNYFDMQQYLLELEESDMIRKIDNKELYTYTQKGDKTLCGLISGIPKNTVALIKKYAINNKDKIKLETQVFANYIKKSDVEYIVILKVVENDIILIELKLNVVSAEQAKQICAKWKQSYFQVYDKIIDILIK